MTLLEILLAPFRVVSFIAGFWWIYLPIILWNFAIYAYTYSKVTDYIVTKWDFVFLEVALQKHLEKTPKAMEQVTTHLTTGQTSVQWTMENISELYSTDNGTAIPTPWTPVAHYIAAGEGIQKY